MNISHLGILRWFSYFKVIRCQSRLHRRNFCRATRSSFSFSPTFSRQRKDPIVCLFPSQQPFRPQPFRVRQPQFNNKFFRGGHRGYCASFIVCPDFSFLLANRELLFYRQQVTPPLRDLDMMSILVSFFHSYLVSNREGLDRRHADYFEGSDSVTVKGRLRVNFVLWQALFYRILSFCHYGRLQDSVPLCPYGCLELGINSPFN